MRYLAREGRCVYALDIRGYGASAAHPVMDAMPDAAPPFARAADAVKDIEAAIATIRRLHDGAAVDLVGFSWGSLAAARYASRRYADVRRLVLYAPLYAESNALWRARIGDPADSTLLDRRFGAYRLVSKNDLMMRWHQDLGTDPMPKRDEAIVDALFAALAEADPQALARTPPAFRCPNGAFADLIEVFNGCPLYDPAQIQSPVLLVRGEADTTSTATDAGRLFASLGSHEKHYLQLAPGSHFLCIENNRVSLYRAIAHFLGEG